jgi:hypothetical protein
MVCFPAHQKISNGFIAALQLQYHHTQLYIHEIALHDDHPPEDFQPPFSLAKVLSIHIDPAATNPHIDAISMIISSAQSILDILLIMELEALRSLPVYNFVRMSSALLMLVKLYISSKSPDSKIGAVLDPATLKIGIYLKATIDKLAKAVGPKECRAPFTFLGMLMRLHGWYKSQEKDQFFTPPCIPTTTDECWLPPVPRVLWDPEATAKTHLHEYEIPFGPKHPQWQPYSIPSGELETLDFSESSEVGTSGALGFDDALRNLQYENIGDVDQFLMMGSGHAHIPGDSWSLTEDVLGTDFVYNDPLSSSLSWMKNDPINHSI